MNDLVKLGTNYGGWVFPKKLQLNENSIIYSAGVGEDISFDIILANSYGCKIFLIDPTERAIKHFDLVKDFYTNNRNEIQGTNPEYINCIRLQQFKEDNFEYLPVALSDCETDIKFYKPVNPEYVSHTVIADMYSSEYETVKADTLSNIMKKQGHTTIDLLKLDIEGAEINVLKHMIQSDIYPKYLAVEFDLFLKGKDPKNETQEIINKLLLKYNIIYNDSANVTFELK